MSRRKGKGAPRSRAPKVQSQKRPAPTQPPKPGVYVPTDITPEELFQAIGRLRREARDEIDRLIRFLDDSDRHMELDEAVDDVPCDDHELEPSLCGVTAGAANMPMGGYDEDLEGDAHEDDEEGHDRENDPADGPLEVNEDGDGNPDDEPSLGWGPDGETGNESGGDRELAAQPSAETMKRARRNFKQSPYRGSNRDGMHVDSEQGFGNFKRLRNLSDRQKKIVTPRLDRDAVHLI
jgi:cobalamin biosynthesis protein CobT